MKPSYIIVHHTGAEERDAGQIKKYHLSLGWQDIGYNYIIEHGGNIVAGRPLDIPGAHCLAGGMNNCSIGVAVIGNMEERFLRPGQERALIELLRDLSGRYQVPVKSILGHREVKGAATACPGRLIDMDVLRHALDGDAEGPPGCPALPSALVQNSPLWRVQAGAFSSRARAEDYARRLQQKGIDTFIVYR